MNALDVVKGEEVKIDLSIQPFTAVIMLCAVGFIVLLSFVV